MRVSILDYNPQDLNTSKQGVFAGLPRHNLDFEKR